MLFPAFLWRIDNPPLTVSPCRSSWRADKTYLNRGTAMKFLPRTLLTASAIAMMVAGSAGAKVLVYCSEGSPEGFDPAPYTAGTTFDASAHPVYNRLVEFKNGTTQTVYVKPDGTILEKTGS